MSDYMKCRWCGSMFSSVTELDGHEILHEEFELFGDFLDGETNNIFWNGEPQVKHPRLEMDSLPASPVAGPSQMGGGPSLPYTIDKVSERTFNNSVIDRHYKVQFNPDEAKRDEKLSNLNEDLTDMFDKVLEEATEGLQDNDLVRVIVHHPDLQNPIYVPLKKIEDMTADTIMEHVENVLNSHQDLAMDDDFFLDVGTMELPKGGARTQINSLMGPNSSLVKKHSILEIKNDDTTCMARAILLGFLKMKQVSIVEWNDMIEDEHRHLPMEELVVLYKTCPAWYFKEIRKEKKAQRQTDLTLEFCYQAHVSAFKYLNIGDIPDFERFLDVDILVICAKMGNKFIRVPSSESQRPRLYIYLVEQDGIPHFHAIINICGFFGSSKFCENCLKPYRKQHSCEIVCFACDRKGCILEKENQVSCVKCHVTFRSLDCFDTHKEVKPRRNKEPSSKCDLFWKCTICKKVIKRSERDVTDHQCGEWKCQNCKQFVEQDHLCYMRALDVKDSSCKFIFFDIETTQNEKWTCVKGYEAVRNPDCKECCAESSQLCKSCSVCKNCQQSTCGTYVHKSNLVIAQKVCNDCIDIELSPASKCETCGMRCDHCNKINKDDKCYEQPPCLESCGFREVVFKGNDCLKDFGQWLFNETHKGFTVFAHNMRAFDGYFLLEYLIDQSIHPDSIIYSGSKIMYMHVARGLNMRILDSLNFLPMPLAKLPGAFDLKELKKGYFPHYFNTTENGSYVGPYPDPKYYGCDSMSSENREKFLKWHDAKVSTEAVFDMRKEIVDYCRSDVDILRRACLTFRNILMTITGREEEYVDDTGEPQICLKNAIDPFQCITIASVCMKVFRTKFLEENWEVKLQQEGAEWLPAKKADGQMSVLVNDEWVHERDLQHRDLFVEESRFKSSPIAQVPTHGYNNDRYSKKSISWLEWCMEIGRRTNKPVHIRHALNESEFKVPNSNYRLDGYCYETNTAYEFNGCLFHGCPHCFPKNRQRTKMPRTKQSLDELYTLTIKKHEFLKSLGMNYIVIWEHEFDELLQRDAEVKSFVHNLDLQTRLDPRAAFFGGRTNAIKLHKRIEQGETIRYCDYTSLYPYCQKYGAFPIGHPTIITTKADDVNINNIFGMVKCKVIAPRGLYFPVLPLKCNGKLMFPLCRSCAETLNQDTCRHATEERAMIGTWCSPELQKALELGYELLKVYEIYHWEETTRYDPVTKTGGLFADYINLFLKIKQESSDWPEWVKSEDDKTLYLDSYLNREGIGLDSDVIHTNKALRSLAKLLLNSFWGKFGQRLNMPQTSFFHEREADKFFRCVSDPSHDVKDFFIVSKDVIQVTWENHQELVPESYQTNIFIAAFTTCWARLKLYEVMEMLQERVLYHDTDSVIYVSKPGDPEPELGDFLGELTSEVDPGDHIVHYVAGGPKQYGYRTLKGQQVCKVRGFSLNHANGKIINFDSMLDLITRPVGKPKLTLVNPSKICRDKRKRKLYNRKEEKKYQIVYTKRVQCKDSFDTLPYGY